MKILVAIDHSPSSGTVLQAAVTRAWPADAQFCVLNVTDLQRFERLPVLIEDAMREGRRLTEEGAQQISGAGYEAFPKTSPGNPRSDIPCFANEWGADLILVGSHGHSAIGRFLLGSVSQAVLRTAPCSVEIVRMIPDSSPFKVLFATDGSDCSLAAARIVADRPWPAGSVFKIISVEEPVLARDRFARDAYSAVYSTSLLEELATQARERARSAVHAAKDILCHASVTLAEGDSVRLGETRGAILEAAKDWGAHLILLGSHGRRGFNRFVMGSVSEAVAIHASCSVQVVRPRQ